MRPLKSSRFRGVVLGPIVLMQCWVKLGSYLEAFEAPFITGPFEPIVNDKSRRNKENCQARRVSREVAG
jgi:hypothetical protein